MDTLKFNDFGLSNDLLKAISSIGFEVATPIQSQSIPKVLQGKDIIGLASTGTGKTAAFALPVIDKIDLNSNYVQLLILCPTRELTMQVAGEITKFLKFKSNINVLAIYGGQPITKQIRLLNRNPKIIVGTPGRTLDHLKRGTLKINKVKVLVLDEADKMLDMGFRPDIERILKVTKKDRQTLLFSATMSKEILVLARRYQRNPETIKTKSNELNKVSIDQFYLNSESAYKIDFLMDLINKYNPKLSIVFCNTKRRVDKVAKILNKTGFLAAGIHGDMRQTKRDSIMNKFRKGKINVLIATDVAARGIDIEDVQIVFNFEIPRETDSYIHRIGRTGRAGKKGKAFSFVSREEFNLFKRVLKYTKADIKKYSDKYLDFSEKSLKTEKQSKEKLQLNYDVHLEKKVDKVLRRANKNITKPEHSVYLKMTENIVSKKYTHKDLSAALLKMVIEDSNKKMPSQYN